MRRITSWQPSASRRRPALGVDVRAFVELHLRDLTRAGRIGELAQSRNALASHYRAEGNTEAVYCLAVAPDFSLEVGPDGSALLKLRRTGDLVSWTRAELLAEAPDAEA